MSVLEKDKTATSPPLTPVAYVKRDGGEEPRDFREEPSVSRLVLEATDVALGNMGIVPPRTSYFGLLATAEIRPTGYIQVDTATTEYSVN